MEVDVPAGAAWTLLTDTWSWPKWGPTVREVDCPNRFIEQGSRGKVLTIAGLWLPFEITAFDPGAYWAWRIGGVRATGHRVTALSDFRCRVAFDAPWLAAPYLLICRLALLRIRSLLLANGKDA